MAGRAAPRAREQAGVPGCRSRRRERSQQSSAPAATDRLAPGRCGARPAARLRPRPDGEIAYGGEVSLSPPRRPRLIVSDADNQLENHDAGTPAVGTLAAL